MKEKRVYPVPFPVTCVRSGPPVLHTGAFYFQKENEMSKKVMDLCWPIHIHPTHKAVLMSLAEGADDHGNVEQTVIKLVERTCFSDHSISRSIKWLESHGYLSVYRNIGGKNVYFINPNGYRGSE